MIPDDPSAERWLWHRVKVELTNGNGEALFHRQNLPNDDRVPVDLALVQAAAISVGLRVVLHLARVLLILANGDRPSHWRQNLPNDDRVPVDLALVQAAAISVGLRVVLHLARVLLILANGDRPSHWR